MAKKRSQAKKRTSAPVATAPQIPARETLTVGANGLFEAVETEIDERIGVGGISIPIGQPAPGYCPKAINSRLSRRQGAALKSVLSALQKEHATCEMEGMGGRGKVVEDYPHAMRWLLDRVADNWEESTGKKLVDCEGLVT